MGEKLKSDFRNLQVWQKCRDIRIIIWNLCKEFPSEERFRLSDQMIRASRSSTSNIAEGYGKRTTPDRVKFYGIARGSAHECGAIFDSLKILKIVDDSIYIHGKTLLHRVVSMLIKMGA